MWTGVLALFAIATVGWSRSVGSRLGRLGGALLIASLIRVVAGVVPGLWGDVINTLGWCSSTAGFIVTACALCAGRWTPEMRVAVATLCLGSVLLTTAWFMEPASGGERMCSIFGDLCHASGLGLLVFVVFERSSPRVAENIERGSRTNGTERAAMGVRNLNLGIILYIAVLLSAVLGDTRPVTIAMLAASTVALVLMVIGVARASDLPIGSGAAPLLAGVRALTIALTAIAATNLTLLLVAPTPNARALMPWVPIGVAIVVAVSAFAKLARWLGDGRSAYWLRHSAAWLGVALGALVIARPRGMLGTSVETVVAWVSIPLVTLVLMRVAFSLRGLARTLDPD